MGSAVEPVVRRSGDTADEYIALLGHDHSNLPYHCSHLGAAQCLGARYQPVAQPDRNGFRKDADKVVVAVCHEAGEQADAGGCTRRLDMHEYVGRGHRTTHRRRKARCQIQFVHLQHRIYEIDERMVGEVLDASRFCVIAQVAARRVQAKSVVAETMCLGPVNLRFADNDLQIEA